MKKQAITVLLLLASVASGAQPSSGQGGVRDYGRGWYAGLGGGPSFGQATFRSVTERGSRAGVQLGAFGGYQFNRLLSLEGLVTTGRQTQTSLDCCPYWLSADGVRTFAPVLDKEGRYYRDLEARTQWTRIGVQANVDLLSLITKPGTRWSVTLSPQVSAVTTRTTHLAAGYEQAFGRQWHLGLGGQAAVGFRVARSVALQVYGGITCLTGPRFDNVPEHCHKSNLIWETGVKVSWHFGRKKSAPAPSLEGPGPAVLPTAAAQPQPVAEEKPVTEETPVEKPIVMTEKPMTEEKPIVAEEQPLSVQLPVIYFAHNSSRLTQSEADKLDAVAALLREHPDVELGIYGHASDTGSEAYNLRLTQRRAATVKALLVRRGISGSRLHPVVGRGIDRGATTSKAARRVELIINEKTK